MSVNSRLLCSDASAGSARTSPGDALQSPRRSGLAGCSVLPRFRPVSGSADAEESADTVPQPASPCRLHPHTRPASAGRPRRRGGREALARPPRSPHQPLVFETSPAPAAPVPASPPASVPARGGAEARSPQRPAGFRATIAPDWQRRRPPRIEANCFHHRSLGLFALPLSAIHLAAVGPVNARVRPKPLWPAHQAPSPPPSRPGSKTTSPSRCSSRIVGRLLQCGGERALFVLQIRAWFARGRVGHAASFKENTRLPANRVSSRFLLS